MTRESALLAAEEHFFWSGLSGYSLSRDNLISVAWPRLKIEQKASSFVFFEPTLLVVLSGRIDITCAGRRHTLHSPAMLGFIDQGVDIDYIKYPADRHTPFRSLFINISPDVLENFYQHFQEPLSAVKKNPQLSTVEINASLDDSLHHLLVALEDPRVSDDRIRLKIFDLLLVLAEQQLRFALPQRQGIFPRLSNLLRDAPERNWTARLAGDALAMSESTLRRRLRQEGVRFEQLLLDIRMHHALMLIQTTHWNLTQVADACGYRSVSRFAERFKHRFGSSPAQLR